MERKILLLLKNRCLLILNIKDSGKDTSYRRSEMTGNIKGCVIFNITLKIVYQRHKEMCIL